MISRKFMPVTCNSLCVSILLQVTDGLHTTFWVWKESPRLAMRRLRMCCIADTMFTKSFATCLRGTRTPSLNFSYLSGRYLYKHLCCSMNQTDKRKVRIYSVFLPDLVMTRGPNMFVSRNKWLRKKTFPWATVVSTLRVVMLYRLLFGHFTFHTITTSQRLETPAFFIVNQFPEFGNVLWSNVENCSRKSRTALHLRITTRSFFRIFEQWLENV